MIRRPIGVTLGITVVLMMLAGPVAWAASDLYSNIGPGMSISGLADRYPIGNYALDEHFAAVKASLTGGVDASGIPPMIAFFLANLLWQITAFIANALITVFGLAFGLDLLNGSSATRGSGALAPVAEVIAGLYAHTFGQAWMVVAITVAGCWAMWRALIQRRYAETAGALAVSLIFCLIALAIVARPQATIGTASRWTNELSTAFLSVTAHGDVATGDAARRGAADELFALLVLRPWVALNFGGTEHCIRTGTGSKDHDPVSVAVRPLPASAAHTLKATGEVAAQGKQCVDNTVRYPAHFLGFSPGSDERDREYDALDDADPSRLPDADPEKATGAYQPAIVDKPVTDAMEKGGQYQRLLLALLVLFAELGAWLLLGALALSVVLSQVIVLLLACFSPVALVAGVIPGRGHALFRTWASHLTTFLVRKAAYSLVLAVVLAVIAALQDATSNLGWLMSFGLQAALLWTVFLQRHRLAGQLAAAVSGRHPEREAQLRRLLGIGYAARLVSPARRPAPPPSATGPGDDHAAGLQRVHADPPATGEALPPAVEAPMSTRPDGGLSRSGHHPATQRPAETDRSADAVAPVAVGPSEARRAHRHARRQRDTTADDSARDTDIPTRRASRESAAARPAQRRHRAGPGPERPDRAATTTPGRFSPRDDDGSASPPADLATDLGAARSLRPPQFDEADASLTEQLDAGRQRPARSGTPPEPRPPARRPPEPEPGGADDDLGERS